MATMIHFDTLKYVNTLKKAGFSDEQSETLTRVQQESLSECLDTTLATREDIQQLALATKEDIQQLSLTTKEDIRQLALETKEDIRQLEKSTQKDMQQLEKSTKADIQGVKFEVQCLESKINLHGWMLGVTMTGVGTILVKLFL